MLIFYCNPTVHIEEIAFDFVLFHGNPTVHKEEIAFDFVLFHGNPTVHIEEIAFDFVLFHMATSREARKLSWQPIRWATFDLLREKSSLLFSCNPILWLQPYIELGTSGPFCLGASTFEVHGVHPRQVYIDAIKPVFFNAA